MLYVGVIKNLEMIDAVVRLAGVAGWLARVIVGPTYGYSSSQGAAVREAGLLPAEVRQRLLTGFFSCSRAASIAAYYLSGEAKNHLATECNRDAQRRYHRAA